MKKILVAMFVVLLLAGCGGEEEKTKVVEEDESTSKPFTIPDLSMEMLWMKPGTFEMGSPLGEANRRDSETPHTVTLTPEKGKANKELIRFIAKSLGISKANLVLLSGETYRKKTDASEGNEQGSGDARFAQKRVRFHSARSRH